ncbi:hypothetical protein GCM10011394_20280 [Luteimonas terricola]|uniref:Uncharacterized protein n=1 Tax=Luteimonas terricola TaxID=645597 RepID=A0ABQ2EFK1_9GAMM|nr:hypothetical protein GCM10011394_20280 [Luteimonas terricola]
MWRIKITSQIKHSILSLFFPRRPSRTTRSRARSKPATSLTRIQAGLPQARSAPAHHVPRRRSSPHVAYIHGSYRLRPRRDSHIGQRMFRIS